MPEDTPDVRAWARVAAIEERIAWLEEQVAELLAEREES